MAAPNTLPETDYISLNGTNSTSHPKCLKGTFFVSFLSFFTGILLCLPDEKNDGARIYAGLTLAILGAIGCVGTKIIENCQAENNGETLRSSFRP